MSPTRLEGRMPRVLSIGRHRVGPGEKPFIIAEAGVNHDGCLETALELVDAACEAGADAVKFQSFAAGDLVTADARSAAYQQCGSSVSCQREMLSKLELSADDFRTIKTHCAKRSILFLATPFSVAAMKDLVALGVPCLKIASTDATNDPLLDAAIETGLPLLLSTGATTGEELDHVVTRMRAAGATDRLALLHCVSCYPTPLGSLNLQAIATMRKTYTLPCGLSDHTTSTRTGGWAVAAGACVIEKHFTLDPTAEGPDHAMSLSPTQLKEYVSAARDAYLAWGDGVLGMAECEAEVRKVATKSVVSAVAIPAGTRLTPEMLTLKRPGTGIPARELQQLAGQHTMVDIPSDVVLSWDMLQ